jgi:hypothetical protein
MSYLSRQFVIWKIKLFNLIVEGQYLTLNPDGSNQYKIVMNTALWEKFYFPYTENSPQSGIYTLLMQNNTGGHSLLPTKAEAEGERPSTSEPVALKRSTLC